MDKKINKGINVLSLFDGISCGQIALQRAGIKVDNYFASEIDKHAISVAEKNYPNTIQLGSVLGWESWDLPKIHLIVGGSPCTGFSRAGKGLNFEDPQSKLYFEFIKAVKHFEPEYFFLENVKMKKEYQDIVSNDLGVQPIEINSSLVSAQNRKRLYWTNISNVSAPADKNIFLDKVLYRLPHGYMTESISLERKYPTLAAQSPGTKHKVIENYELSEYAKSRVNERKNNKTGLVYSWYNDKVHIEKTPTLTSNSNCWSATGGIIVIENEQYRTLTPEECEELQTLPHGYTNNINKTQRYKCIGNGWTVDVIAHIFSSLPQKFKNE